jgi:branched-chain amino acid transport system permease protein
MQVFNLPFWTFVGVIAGIYTILSLGLFVQFAMAGLPNFGHVAFMALAAYTMAILVIRLSAPMWLAALAGLLAAVGFAVLLGGPSLRLRADYLAIVTVAAGEIVRYLALNLLDLTGGAFGSVGMLARAIWLSTTRAGTPCCRALRQRWLGRWAPLRRATLRCW